MGSIRDLTRRVRLEWAGQGGRPGALTRRKRGRAAPASGRMPRPGAWACSGGVNAVASGCCRRRPALAVECKGWITGAPWVNERACGIE